MTCLEPGERHVYRVLGPAGWSNAMWFNAIPEGSDWSPRVAVFADLGVQDATTVPFLTKDVQSGMYDAALHVGDFAYELVREEGKRGDRFLRQMQPIAAHVPYMTCAGNAEQYANYTDYKHRFSMPGGTEGMYYSFNMGPVHFVGINTGFYYFKRYGHDQLVSQYYWLNNDLKEASTRSRREKRPWIVLFGHRPMYCQKDVETCQANYVTNPVPGDQKNPSIEYPLNEYGVDLALWAHKHVYHRTWPVAFTKVKNGTGADPYRNPGAPVHITVAQAGNKHTRKEHPEPKPWTAFRNTADGYTRLHFHNHTHMSIEQVAVSETGTASVIDRATIVKEAHMPYSFLEPTDRGYMPVKEKMMGSYAL
ncbi:Acid phosphatase type 7 [Amphibalanus amphitrite]|uniref:Acid phosphatase type 7 n=1 Tax=Amphibalanus amphitrite TaxID=1232801 RepID=A0A6A4VG79_AMPAM|nr:Acid phosphatase type 7 [Amphibalanus amphitrite]